MVGMTLLSVAVDRLPSCVEAVKSDGETCMWFEDGYCDTGCNMRGSGSTDASTCSGDTISTQATIAAGSVADATTTAPATVSQATVPIDFTTTTSSTGSAALFRADPASSGNTVYSSFFFVVWSSIFVALFL